MKKTKGFNDKNTRHLHIRFRNDIADIISERATKQNISMSEYCRNIINQALVKGSDLDTKVNIVGFNHSNNDKVTKINGPATFRKVDLNNRSIKCMK